MTRPDDPRSELFSEPLEPIEEKLIKWSLGLGVVSLILLGALSRLLPT